MERERKIIVTIGLILLVLFLIGVLVYLKIN
jgi:cbb3-type cytochrome oxidase subunit 3